MPTFYHSPGGGRRRGLSLAVVAAVAVAALNAGEGAGVTDIALITAIVLVATGIIGLGTYLIVRAARRPIASPPAPFRASATVINLPSGGFPAFSAPVIQGGRPGKFLALPAAELGDGAEGAS